MANKMNVNPTRMELTRLKKRLNTARRGHKLLKDKRDEMMKQFLELVRQNRAVRARVEQSVMLVHRSFTVASSAMSPESMKQALMLPKQSVDLTQSYKNVMSVEVPVFHFTTTSASEGDIYPYGFADTSAELDGAIDELNKLMDDLLTLAGLEKSVQLLADEIEKTRRRVNALEYVMIPRLEETIKYISMKLEENERGNITRLMKVKDMMIEEQLRKAAVTSD